MSKRCSIWHDDRQFEFFSCMAFPAEVSSNVPTLVFLSAILVLAVQKSHFVLSLQKSIIYEIDFLTHCVMRRLTVN